MDYSTLNPATNPLSPLALHSNDNPAISIVLDPLNGPNFVSWSHAIKRALSVKNKAPLIDGSLIPPTSMNDPVVHAAWVRANDLVLVWMLNSMVPEVKKTLEYFTSAREVWLELHARYSKSDLARVYELEKSLSSVSKGNQSLVTYYNTFKSLWDEYVSFRPTLRCSCGVMVNCTCNLPVLMSKTQERDAIMKFMIGLDDSYSAVRSQIFLQKPLPSLSEIYSLLLQEESQRALSHPVSVPVSEESIAMLAKNKFYKDKKRTPITCSHCKAPNHTIDRCFQLIGYPPGWKGPRGPRSDTTANMIARNQDDSKSVSMPSNPLFNQDLFEQFLSYAQSHSVSQAGDKDHSVAGAFAQLGDGSKEAVTGEQNIEADWFC